MPRFQSWKHYLFPKGVWELANLYCFIVFKALRLTACTVDTHGYRVCVIRISTCIIIRNACLGLYMPPDAWAIVIHPKPKTTRTLSKPHLYFHSQVSTIAATGVRIYRITDRILFHIQCHTGHIASRSGKKPGFDHVSIGMNKDSVNNIRCIERTGSLM